MKRYMVVRVSQSILVLFAVSIIIFGLARLSGNPLDVLLSDDADAADFELMAKRWGAGPAAAYPIFHLSQERIDRRFRQIP